jgi:hypothetical protein
MKFPREKIELEWVISVKYLKDIKNKIENRIPIKYISDLDLEDIEAVLLALEISNKEMPHEIPICARCGHKATMHVVDGEERRECMEWGCDCEQFDGGTMDGENSHPGMKRR